jgi:hypothetical protein
MRGIIGVVVGATFHWPLNWASAADGIGGPKGGRVSQYSVREEDVHARCNRRGRGDSDTIPCITGAIAHAFYGVIPRHLIDPVLEIYMSPDLADTSLKFCNCFGIPLER